MYTDNDIWSYMNKIVGHHSVESTLSQENPPESIQQMINSWTSVDRIPLISVYVHRKVGEIAVNLVHSLYISIYYIYLPICLAINSVLILIIMIISRVHRDLRFWIYEIGTLILTYFTETYFGFA